MFRSGILYINLPTAEVQYVGCNDKKKLEELKNMRILYVTTIGITMNFFKDLVKSLIDDGNTVDIACNESLADVPECYYEWKCRVHHIDCSRSPIDKGNLRAVKQIREIVAEGKYDIVHCHTPVAAMCTRLACKKNRKRGVKVIYTAHGFHFFKGAPLKNWMLYFSMEWMCAWWTDLLITINQEDYERAKRCLHAKEIKYVPGVGINTGKFVFKEGAGETKRLELGVDEHDIMLLSVGELNRNKNHEVVIRAIKRIGNPQVKYFICGVGELEKYLSDLIQELGLQEQVHLLGYRKDICELYQATDLCVFPSKREGLPVALMEAIACKTPVVCSYIRGNVDLVKEKECTFTSTSVDELFECVSSKFGDGSNHVISLRRVLAEKMKTSVEGNLTNLKQFELENVVKIMKRIYDEKKSL